MTSNRRILLAERPVEMFTESSFRVVDAPVPKPGDGEAVVEVEYLSLDPTMRGWARDEPSYLPPVQLGEVMRGGAAGHVVASNNAAYPVGASVMGLLGWQEYAVVGGTTGMLANVLPDGIDLVDALSLYGSTGVTRTSVSSTSARSRRARRSSSRARPAASARSRARSASSSGAASSASRAARRSAAGSSTSSGSTTASTTRRATSAPRSVRRARKASTSTSTTSAATSSTPRSST